MTELLQADKENIWHPFTPLVSETQPLLIKSVNGIYLHTADNRKIIDAISSWWVNLHGHSHPHIAQAIAKQAQTLEHVIFAGFTHEPAITLSKNLLTILPNNQEKIFFSDNGSTAVEVALKMALQYWHNQGIQKKKIIAFEGAYHGDTFGAMAVGARGLFTEPFSSYLFEVETIPFPNKGNEEKSLTALRELVKNQQVGVFIFEPLVQGASGMRMYSSAILNDLIKEAQRNDVICIADEVFTGFGRTGKLLASDYLTVQPDIITLSKGITGGFMPLGVTSVSKKITSTYTTPDFKKTFFHGHSYTANPIACAAANASFELLMDDSCAQQIELINQQHKRFEKKVENHSAIDEVRIIGTILAIELRTTEESSYTNEWRKKIYPYFLERNILLRPLGNIIYILPPYCITASELEVVYNNIISFLDTEKSLR